MEKTLTEQILVKIKKEKRNLLFEKILYSTVYLACVYMAFRLFLKAEEMRVSEGFSYYSTLGGVLIGMMAFMAIAPFVFRLLVDLHNVEIDQLNVKYEKLSNKTAEKQLDFSKLPALLKKNKIFWTFSQMFSSLVIPTLLVAFYIFWFEDKVYEVQNVFSQIEPTVAAVVHVSLVVLIAYFIKKMGDLKKEGSENINSLLQTNF